MNGQKYVVAVSGGVDSVVLLHKLMHTPRRSPLAARPSYIVAHFDHGIRPDSHKDAELVKSLAEQYDLKFELGTATLGKDASEAEAREARYTFLRSVKDKHQALKIITAHHQDDVIETMVMNMLRGTGPRGLSPMSTSDVLRPLVHSTKQQLIDYAQEHKLAWYEDSTNDDETYLRNSVRKTIMPKLAPAVEKLLAINRRVSDLYSDIDIRISLLLPQKNMLFRPSFVVLPYGVQKELVRAWLVRCGIKDIDAGLIERFTIACKTLPIGKKIDVDGTLWLKSGKSNLLLTSK